MSTPKATLAEALGGQEWFLIIQNGKLARAQINEVITFARAHYSTDNLPEGTQHLYFTNQRALDALENDLDAIADILAQKADKQYTVVKVNGQTGEVTLKKGDFGLDKVDNTKDSEKPISTAQQTALDAKVNKPGAANVRTVAFATAYQATDKTKTAFVSVTLETEYTVTLAGTQADTVELRIGPDSAQVLAGSGGHVAATFKSSLTGVTVSIGMKNLQRNQLIALLPPNWFFAVRRVVGTTATIQGAYDQSL